MGLQPGGSNTDRRSVQPCYLQLFVVYNPGGKQKVIFGLWTQGFPPACVCEGRDANTVICRTFTSPQANCSAFNSGLTVTRAVHTGQQTAKTHQHTHLCTKCLHACSKCANTLNGETHACMQDRLTGT